MGVGRFNNKSCTAKLNLGTGTQDIGHYRGDQISLSVDSPWTKFKNILCYFMDCHISVLQLFLVEEWVKILSQTVDMELEDIFSICFFYSLW